MMIYEIVLNYRKRINKDSIYKVMRTKKKVSYICEWCKKKFKSQEKTNLCPKCQKKANVMKCDYCGNRLKIFIGNPLKKKRKVLNFCSEECKDKYLESEKDS